MPKYPDYERLLAAVTPTQSGIELTTTVRAASGVNLLGSRLTTLTPTEKEHRHPSESLNRFVGST